MLSKKEIIVTCLVALAVLAAAVTTMYMMAEKNTNKDTE
jgi:hypothetical protein